MQSSVKQYKYDMMGIASSFLCMVHCTIIPLFFTIHPIFHRLSENEAYLNYGFLALSFIAVFHTAKQTASWPIKLSFYLFFILFSSSIVLSDQEEWLEYVSYFASAGLTLTHIVKLILVNKKDNYFTHGIL